MCHNVLGEPMMLSLLKWILFQWHKDEGALAANIQANNVGDEAT
jgi:hypothetical protein